MLQSPVRLLWRLVSPAWSVQISNRGQCCGRLTLLISTRPSPRSAPRGCPLKHCWGPTRWPLQHLGSQQCQRRHARPSRPPHLPHLSPLHWSAAREKTAVRHANFVILSERSESKGLGGRGALSTLNCRLSTLNSLVGGSRSEGPRFSGSAWAGGSDREIEVPEEPTTWLATTGVITPRTHVE